MANVVTAVKNGNKQYRIGRFILSKRVGKGMEGTVYLARDEQIGRPVAIKLLHQAMGRSDHPGHAGKVPIEARALGRLHHPNIVAIYEIGKHADRIYLVFEYVSGETLWTYVRTKGAVPYERACQLMQNILQGVAHAHAQGITHLDLSPRNIMLDAEGVPRIMDFGLSRLAENLNDTGQHVIGTPRYMSPEHFTATRLGPHTDVYALGLIFYELLAGHPVIQAKDDYEIIQQIKEGVIATGPLLEADSHGRIGKVILRALSREPGERYADACEMLDDYRRAMEPLEAEKHHATVEFLLRKMKRKKDFPALSRTLIDINQMTSVDSKASGKQLANTILRDYAVTNKLLKLANSSFYAGFKGQVKTVSDAIRILGMDQVRQACNTLMFFNHMQDKEQSVELQDSLIASFMSGLMARHLATTQGLRNAEEAFLCGMFHDLGRSLVIFYFPDEYQEILDIMREHDYRMSDAAKEVLGLHIDELGIAVARDWGFPEVILQSMQSRNTYRPSSCASDERKLHVLAMFANELCHLPELTRLENKAQELDELSMRYADSLSINSRSTHQLLAAGIQKLTSFAPVLGVNVARSPHLKQIADWLSAEYSLAEDIETVEDEVDEQEFREEVTVDVTEVTEQAYEATQPMLQPPGSLFRRLKNRLLN